MSSVEMRYWTLFCKTSLLNCNKLPHDFSKMLQLITQWIAVVNKMCLWNKNAPDNATFQRWPRSQKYFDARRKILSQEGSVTRNTHINIKAPALTIQMLLTKLKLSKRNPKVKVTKSKLLVPMKRSSVMKYLCEKSTL